MTQPEPKPLCQKPIHRRGNAARYCMLDRDHPGLCYNFGGALDDIVEKLTVWSSELPYLPPNVRWEFTHEKTVKGDLMHFKVVATPKVVK